MSGSMEYIDCPKCGHADAAFQEDVWSTWMLCDRCGYTIDKRPDLLPWEPEELGGNGCFHLTSKRGAGVYLSPVEITILNNIMRDLDKFGRAEYTFEEDGKWFIRDLLKNETRPFPEPTADESE